MYHVKRSLTAVRGGLGLRRYRKSPAVWVEGYIDDNLNKYVVDAAPYRHNTCMHNRMRSKEER